MGLSKSDRRVIVDYLRATENEIAVDMVAYASCGITPAQAGCLPRPSKWFHKAGSHLNMLKLGGRVLAGMWPLGLAAILGAIELLLLFAHLKLKAGRSSLAVPEAAYGLGFSSRAAEVIREDIFPNVPSCWLVLPWVSLTTAANTRQINVLSLLRFRELLSAYLLAMRAVRLMSRRQAMAPWILQSYTALRWFVVRAAVSKVSGPFWIAEHFDRWAVLADSVARQRRLGVPAGDDAPRLVLVQHGIVGVPSDTGEIGLPYSLPYRLKAVDVLYAYDRSSSTIFRQRILARRAADAVDVRFFTPNLVLSGGRHPRKFGILFVGHPVCERLHLFLYDRLRHYPDIQVFYKPHPTSAASSNVKNESWEFIADKTWYPNVDLLISYPSTLVTEYALFQVDALVHPLNLDVLHSEGFLQSIESRLELRNTIRY
jgi:hypothetical protein